MYIGKDRIVSQLNLEPGTKVPAGQVWSGNPAQYLRDVNPEEMNILTSLMIGELASMHAEESSKSFSTGERAKFKELKKNLDVIQYKIQPLITLMIDQVRICIYFLSCTYRISYNIQTY